MCRAACLVLTPKQEQEVAAVASAVEVGPSSHFTPAHYPRPLRAMLSEFTPFVQPMTLPRVWWTSRPVPLHYTSPIITDDILSHIEDKHTNVIRGTISVELAPTSRYSYNADDLIVCLHSANGGLPPSSLLLVGLPMPSLATPSSSTGSDLALQLADAASLVPATSASTPADVLTRRASWADASFTPHSYTQHTLGRVTPPLTLEVLLYIRSWLSWPTLSPHWCSSGETSQMFIFITLGSNIKAHAGFDASEHETPSMSRHHRKVPALFFYHFT